MSERRECAGSEEGRTYLEFEHDGEKVEDTLAELARLGPVLAHAFARGCHVSNSCFKKSAVSDRCSRTRHARRTSIASTQQRLVQTDSGTLKSFDALRVLERLLREGSEVRFWNVDCRLRREARGGPTFK
jgi:hypothetical protein